MSDDDTHTKIACDLIDEAIEHLKEISKDESDKSKYYWNCINKLGFIRYKVKVGYREGCGYDD